MTAPLVDVHAHVMPAGVLDQLSTIGSADMSDASKGVVRIDPEISGLPPGAPIPFPREQYDLDARLEAMDAAGVTVQAVSIPPFLMASGADDRRCLEVIRAANDAVAGLVAESSGRLVGLGAAPVGRDGVADEASRCVDELGLSGLVIGTSGAGRELDHAVNHELWELASQRRIFVLLHPSGTFTSERLEAYHLVQLVGFPTDTALATARLAFGGVLDATPLRLCLAHGGGCAPWLLGRLDLGWERKPVSHTTAVRPSELVRSLLVDTAVFDARQLRRLIDDFGADHVLVGTDFPFDLADRDPKTTLSGMALPGDQLAAIAWQNAARLLGLEDLLGEAVSEGPR